MRVIAAVALAVTLGGCGDIEAWKVEQLLSKCEKHGGLAQISTVIRTDYGICRDGATVYTKRPGASDG